MECGSLRGNHLPTSLIALSSCQRFQKLVVLCMHLPSVNLRTGICLGMPDGHLSNATRANGRIIKLEYLSSLQVITMIAFRHSIPTSLSPLCSTRWQAITDPRRPIPSSFWCSRALGIRVSASPEEIHFDYLLLKDVGANFSYRSPKPPKCLIPSTCCV